MTPWGAVLQELRLFFVALQFLTRVPVPRWVGHDPAWLNRCVSHFPLVGALVGAAGAAVMLIGSQWWPPPVVALMAVLMTVWLTGAFHEDGLADTFDALGGAVPREKALAIMKDSRIGTYGAVALVLVIGLRVALLSALLQHGALAASLALIGVSLGGRGAAVAVMAMLPYAGDADHAKAKPLATAVPHASVGVAMVLTSLMLTALAVCGPREDMGHWLVAAASAALVAMGMRRWLKRRLGGYTGDTLGATEQLVEVAMLLAMAAA